MAGEFPDPKNLARRSSGHCRKGGAADIIEIACPSPDPMEDRPVIQRRPACGARSNAGMDLERKKPLENRARALAGATTPRPTGADGLLQSDLQSTAVERFSPTARKPPGSTVIIRLRHGRRRKMAEIVFAGDEGRVETSSGFGDPDHRRTSELAGRCFRQYSGVVSTTVSINRHYRQGGQPPDFQRSCR